MFHYEDGACVLTGLITITSVNEVFQIIELVITIILLLISMILRITKWIKTSLEDKKIDADELNDLEDILNESKDKFKNLKR